MLSTVPPVTFAVEIWADAGTKAQIIKASTTTESLKFLYAIVNSP
jgi:hypothetical protein